MYSAVNRVILKLFSNISKGGSQINPIVCVDAIHMIGGAMALVANVARNE
jgi:hypothetical protein